MLRAGRSDSPESSRSTEPTWQFATVDTTDLDTLSDIARTDSAENSVLMGPNWASSYFVPVDPQSTREQSHKSAKSHCRSSI
eukprot:SAG31_NODE_37299_length_305_cov_1.101942_1_plen_81_part_01